MNEQFSKNSAGLSKFVKKTHETSTLEFRTQTFSNKTPSLDNPIELIFSAQLPTVRHLLNLLVDGLLMNKGWFRVDFDIHESIVPNLTDFGQFEMNLTD